MNDKKKLILLIVLGVIATISLLYGIVTPSKARVRTKAAIARPAAVQAGSNVQDQSTAMSIKRRAKRSTFKSYKRNPFSPQGAPSAAAPNLVLSGILGGGKNLKASIGDEIVGKGDKVAGYTVVEVKSDRVILNNGAKNIVLKME